jgi:hypothetical protein
MIYSQYGCVIVRVKELNLDTGLCKIVLAAEGKYPESTKEDYPIIALRADNGFEEIKEAAEVVIDSIGPDAKGGNDGIVKPE